MERAQPLLLRRARLPQPDGRSPARRRRLRGDRGRERLRRRGRRLPSCPGRRFGRHPGAGTSLAGGRHTARRGASPSGRGVHGGGAETPRPRVPGSDELDPPVGGVTAHDEEDRSGISFSFQQARERLRLVREHPLELAAEYKCESLACDVEVSGGGQAKPGTTRRFAPDPRAHQGSPRLRKRASGGGKRTRGAQVGPVASSRR
jgi:hypothetical protein